MFVYPNLTVWSHNKAESRQQRWHKGMKIKIMNKKCKTKTIAKFERHEERQ